MLRPVFLALICIFSLGCRDQTKIAHESDIPAISPRAAVKLTLLVVDDLELAAGIKLLSGEWNERSGGELVVEATSLDDFLNVERLTADVIVYPTRQLGTLVSRQWLRPARQSMLNSTELDQGDLLPVVRDQSMRFGGEVWGVPLGEMPLVLDWYGAVPTTLPKTWNQLAEIPQYKPGTKDKSPMEFPYAAEFIARVVAATSPMDRASLFFDLESMDANLDQLQMVRVLEKMQEVASENATGESFSCRVSLPPREEQLAEHLSSLLPAAEVFNSSLDRWENPTSDSPPVICGFSGRLVSVTSASRNAASAFKLLPWLVSGNKGARLSQRSRATLWFRHSQVSEAANWLPAQSAAENAAWLTQSLSRRNAYLVPRLPGIDKYLATLNEALMSKPIPEALFNAEREWNAITDALGREQQRKAFRQHLGLTE